MGYAFISVGKLKSSSALGAAYNHNFRTMEVKNANRELASLNEELVGLNGKTYQQAFEERISSLPYYQNHKLHSKAVYAFEVMLTFSPSERDRIDLEAWKKDNVEWLRNRFNPGNTTQDNVMSVVYHGDEAGNCHCHAIIVPINEEGKLSAKSFIDGPADMRQLQTDYGKLMKEKHGLERGMEYSTAKHEDIKRFYTILNKTLETNKAPEIMQGETLEQYKARVDTLMKDIALKQFATEKEKERDIAEAVTAANNRNRIFNNSTQIEVKKLRKKVEEHEHLIRDYGPLPDIRRKLEAMESLNQAISTHPEEQKREETRRLMNEMILYGNKERRKKKDRSKEK